MSEGRNYAGIALSAIEVDDKPLPAPLEEWVATGVFRDIYMPIPNPLFPPGWIAQGEHDSWDVVQAWVRRFRYLLGLHPSKHSQKGLELQAMSSCAGLHELVVQRHVTLEMTSKDLEMTRTALFRLASCIKDEAVAQDWCDTYEDRCETYLSTVNRRLTGELREALMRMKRVNLTRTRPIVVWIEETIVDVEVPFGFDAELEDAMTVSGYFGDYEDTAFLERSSDRIVRVEDVEGFDTQSYDVEFSSLDV